MKKTIAIASDHAGVDLKKELKEILAASGYTILDLGAHSSDSVDYPDFAHTLADNITQKKAEFGILTCGSGIGMSIAANRHKGIRAALCHDGLSAALSRKHNNANVLCLGARLIGVETAKDCVRQFLETSFEGGRHEKRVAKMDI